MKTREEILSILAKEKFQLATKFQLKELSLFGSYARGDQREDSDIDIIVDCDPSIGLDFVTLADQIEELLGQSADVVSIRAIKPKYWHEIEQDIIYV